MDEIDEPVSRFPRRDRPSSISTAFLSARCSDRRIVVIRQQLFTNSFVYLRAIQHGNFAGILVYWFQLKSSRTFDFSCNKKRRNINGGKVFFYCNFQSIIRISTFLRNCTR